MPNVTIITIGTDTNNPGEPAVDEKDYGHMKLRLHSSFDASTDRRNIDADLYAADVRRAYLTNKDRYSQVDSMAFRLATESGAGRTRIESNTPAGSQIVGGP